MFDVIVPVFKTRPELIQKCLNSLAAQQFKDFEVWVVDGTPEDHERYSAINQVYQDFENNSEIKFHILRQTGKGVSQARNQAIELGSRPYIAFLDSDDMWYSERLLWASQDLPARPESQVLWWGVMNATKTLTGLTGDSYSANRLAGFLDEKDWNKFQTNWEPGQDWFFSALRPIMTSACIVRRNRFEEIGGFKTTLFFGEDTDMWMRLVGNPLQEKTVYRLSYEPDLIGYYHCHDEQTTAGGMQTSAYQEGANPQELIQAIADQKSQQVLLYFSPEQISEMEGFAERYGESFNNHYDYWVWLLSTFRDSSVFDTRLG